MVSSCVHEFWVQAISCSVNTLTLHVLRGMESREEKECREGGKVWKAVPLPLRLTTGNIWLLRYLFLLFFTGEFCFKLPRADSSRINRVTFFIPTIVQLPLETLRPSELKANKIDGVCKSNIFPVK